MTIFGGWTGEKYLANTTVLRFGESMTSSIFGGNGRRVIEYRGEALVAYHLPIDQHSDQRCTGRSCCWWWWGGGGGGGGGR